MKRLLLISYEFPPKGGTQSQHVAKMAVALAEAGWDVTALTVEDPPSSMLDTEMLGEVTRRVDIVTAWSAEPTRAIQALRRLRPASKPAADGKPSASGSRGYTKLPRWAIRAIQALFVPDEKRGWAPYALKAAVEAHALQPFDVVVSSGPPFTAHHVADRFSLRTGVPWIADFRDPVVGGYFFRPVTPLHARWYERFERRIVAHASALVVTTDAMRDDILSRIPSAADRVVTLPNGYDDADFRSAEPVRDPDHLTLSYVGTFQATIRPDAFLEALALFAAREPDADRELRVKFVGPLDPETDDAIERTGTRHFVERCGFVSHADAIEAMRATDVNLLVLGPEPESAGIITSKLPEYLAAGRAILALVPEGVAADVVRRAQAGPIAAPSDIEAIEGAIAALYRQWRSGTLPVPDPEVAAEFDRRRIIERLSAILEGATRKIRSDDGD